MLHDLIAPLNHVIVTIGLDHVTWAELLGFVTGIACVYLTAKERVSNFPVSIANAAFFWVLFWSAGLFADAWLQVMYLVLSAVGWWAWLKAGPARTELHVISGRWWELACAWAVAVGVTTVLYPILLQAHDIAPFWDSLTTGLSVAAQLLLNFKRLQNWYYWMAADLVYIPLYFVKHLYLTGLVYVVFFGICIGGLSYWRSRVAPKPVFDLNWETI